ncbi:MAG: hypothetical protein AB1297_05155 [bacterium]
MKKIILFIALCITLVGCKKEEISILGKIAFLTMDYDRKEAIICTMNLDGTDKKKLMKTFFPINMFISASPDGTKIAFTIYSKKQKGSNIWILDTETGSQTRLTDDNSFNTPPCWSPNSKKLAFSSNRDGNYEVYTIDVDGSNLKRLTDNLLNDYPSGWSPDGEKIAFSRVFVEEKRGGDLVDWNDGHIIKEGGTYTEISYQIYLMDQNGKNIEKLAEGFKETSSPLWLSDGKKIVFNAEDVNGKETSFIIDVASKKIEKLMEETGVFYARSPDGKKIAFVDYNKERLGIYTVNIDDKKIHKIIRDLKGTVGGPLIWTQDEKMMIFTLISPDRKNSDIYSLNLNGKLKNLTNTPNISEYNPQWLPIQEIK